MGCMAYHRPLQLVPGEARASSRPPAQAGPTRRRHHIDLQPGQSARQQLTVVAPILALSLQLPLVQYGAWKKLPACPTARRASRAVSRSSGRTQQGWNTSSVSCSPV